MPEEKYKKEDLSKFFKILKDVTNSTLVCYRGQKLTEENRIKIIKEISESFLFFIK